MAKHRQIWGILINMSNVTANLETHFCKFCKRDIITATCQPVTAEESKNISGHLFTYLNDDYDNVILGYVCFSCAEKLYEYSLIGFICGGGDMEAIAERKYFQTERNTIYELLKIPRLMAPKINRVQGCSYYAYDEHQKRRNLK